MITYGFVFFVSEKCLHVVGLRKSTVMFKNVCYLNDHMR